MDKKALTYWVRRVYKRLKDPDFVFKIRRLKDCQGLISWEPDDQEVHVDLRPDCQLIPTVIHEIIHSMNICLEEKQVLALEREIMFQLSHRQMINIMFATATALKRDLGK